VAGDAPFYRATIVAIYTSPQKPEAAHRTLARTGPWGGPIWCIYPATAVGRTTLLLRLLLPLAAAAAHPVSVHVLRFDLPHKVNYSASICRDGPYGVDAEVIDRLSVDSVPIDDADFILVPYSHGCEMHAGRIHQQIPAANVTLLEDAYKQVLHHALSTLIR
jgi:hypothetical protein